MDSFTWLVVGIAFLALGFFLGLGTNSDRVLGRYCESIGATHHWIDNKDQCLVRSTQVMVRIPYPFVPKDVD